MYDFREFHRYHYNQPKINFTLKLLNILAKWLALLLCIWGVMGSNLSPETGYADCGFLWFSSVPPGPNHDLPYLLQLIIH
jgi:hypothetical protein